jgi:hypothetical protein
MMIIQKLNVYLFKARHTKMATRFRALALKAKARPAAFLIKDHNTGIAMAAMTLLNLAPS